MVWLEPSDVASYASIEGDIEGNDALTDATAAAVAFVERVRPDLQTGQAAGFVPTADVKLGATMLAGRWYERRGSLLGVAGFASAYETGSTPLLRHDPDIEQLLQIGRKAPFGFGAAS